MNFKRLQPALIGALVLGTAGMWGCTNTKPPGDLLAQTQAEIEKARYLGAQELAPVELLDAEDKLARAQSAIENKQYEQASNFLEQAIVDAEHAAIKSSSTKARAAAGTVNENIEVLRKELEEQAKGTREYSGEPGEYSGEDTYY
jgi:hypothetical protein